MKGKPVILLAIVALLQDASDGHQLKQRAAHRSTAYSRHRLQQKSRLNQQVTKQKLFEESGFDTKADMGEAEPTVLTRESWGTEDPNVKPSGWVNPLSLTDDGLDDDSVLDMGFKPLDEPYRKFIMPTYRYDEDIDASMRSQAYAETEVGKQMEARKKAEEQQAEKDAKAAAEAAKKQAEKKPEAPNAAPAKQEAAPSEQKAKQSPKKEGEKDKAAAPAEQAAPKKAEEKAPPAPAEAAKPTEEKPKPEASKKKEEAPAPAAEKPAAPAKKAADKKESKPATKAAQQTVASVMQVHNGVDSIDVMELDDDEIIQAQQEAVQQESQDLQEEQEPQQPIDNTDTQEVDEYSLKF